MYICVRVGVSCGLLSCGLWEIEKLLKEAIEDEI